MANTSAAHLISGSPTEGAIHPHHDGSPLHVSTQTPALGDTVLVRLRVPSGYGTLEAVRVRSNPDHEPAWTEAVLLGSADGWDWWEAPVVAVNPRHGYRWLLVHAPGEGIRGRAEWLNQSGLHTIETLDAEDFALLATPAAPEWLAETVMYQVFPDRFARSAAADDNWLSTAYGRDSGYIAVHRFFREDPEEYFRAVEKIMIGHGGRPHWGKMHYRDAASLRTVYPRFDDFLAVREQLDPGRVFANPYLRQVLGD